MTANYIEADRSVLFHWGDPDLRPIRLSLPNPPNKELIDGYGIPFEEQRFKRLEVPLKLRRAEKKALEVLEGYRQSNKNFTITRYKLQKEFWEIIEGNREFYSEEIDFIKKIWWHRLHGFWFYNRGKPTYITGWHFMYLNFWYMPDVPGGYPDYRDRDRKEFIYHLYTYTTTETFKYLGKDGYAIPNPDGSYSMRDMGKRVCYGPIQSKNRRSGNTNKGLNNVMEITTRSMGTDGGGIMSYTGNNADAHFKQKLMLAWTKWPLFTQPMSTSGNSPTALSFGVNDNEFRLRGLQNAITPATTADSKFFDGKKLVASLCDEEGKSTETQVDERWQVMKNCHSQGNGSIIFGYSYHPSTVEEYTSGGAAYKDLAEKSCIYQRIDVSGQTSSGLFRVFLPADESLDGYIDSYGNSVKGIILDYQRKEGFNQTATEYLEGIREYYKNLGTPEAMSEYRSQLKLFPLKYADSWLGDAGEVGFDMQIIDERIIELQRNRQSIRGNFVWKNRFHDDVVWKQDDEGRFEVSRLFSDRANRRVRDTIYDPVDMSDKDTWAPLDPGFATAGADPFKFKSSSEIKKSYTRQGMSDGGMTIIWDYDEKVDGGRPRSEWESDSVICTYRYRPATDDEFCEDVLKACIWYGALLYPEMNIPTIYKKFREWGYLGYLKYDISPDGIVKNEPGIHMLSGSKQEGFTLARDFISFRGKKIKHLGLLQECKNITSFDDLTNHDLLASFIVALLGSRSRYSKILKQSGGDNIDISAILSMHRY